MNKLDFPTKKELRNSYNLEFKVYIPSTRDRNIKISGGAFRKRIEMATIFFAKRFGGASIDVEQGAYMLKGKAIKESVAVIIVNTNQELYNRYDNNIKRYLQSKKKSWGQDSMGFVYDGNMIFI